MSLLSRRRNLKKKVYEVGVTLIIFKVSTVALLIDQGFANTIPKLWSVHLMMFPRGRDYWRTKIYDFEVKKSSRKLLAVPPPLAGLLATDLGPRQGNFS